MIHGTGAGLCLVLLAAAWVFGVAQILSESDTKTSLIEDDARALRDAEAAEAGLDRAKQHLEAIRSDLNQTSIRLQPRTELNPLLGQLADWAETHRLIMSRTQAESSVSLAYYDYVPIRLAGEGAYVDFLSLMDLVVDERSDLSVQRFDVRRQSGSTSAQISFEIDLAWYVLKPTDLPASSTGDSPLTASADERP